MSRDRLPLKTKSATPSRISETAFSSPIEPETTMKGMSRIVFPHQPQDFREVVARQTVIGKDDVPRPVSRAPPSRLRRN